MRAVTFGLLLALLLVGCNRRDKAPVEPLAEGATAPGAEPTETACDGRETCPAQSQCLCDDRGNLVVAALDQDGDGRPERRTVMTYDASNRRTAIEMDVGVDGIVDARAAFSYDEAGAKTERWDRDNNGFFEAHRFFNAEGHLVRSDNYDETSEALIRRCVHNPPCPSPFVGPSCSVNCTEPNAANTAEPDTLDAPEADTFNTVEPDAVAPQPIAPTRHGPRQCGGDDRCPAGEYCEDLVGGPSCPECADIRGLCYPTAPGPIDVRDTRTREWAMVLQQSDTGRLAIVDAISGQVRVTLDGACPTVERVWPLHDRTFLLSCDGIQRLDWEGETIPFDAVTTVDEVSADGRWIRSGATLVAVDTGQRVEVNTDLPLYATERGFNAGPDSEGQLFAVHPEREPVLNPLFRLEPGVIPIRGTCRDFAIDRDGQYRMLGRRADPTTPIAPPTPVDPSEVAAAGFRHIVLEHDGVLFTHEARDGRVSSRLERVTTHWWLGDAEPVIVDPCGDLAIYRLESDDASIFGVVEIDRRGSELVGVYTLEGRIVPPLLDGGR